MLIYDFIVRSLIIGMCLFFYEIKNYFLIFSDDEINKMKVNLIY